jgi:hypothetical protein
MPRPEDFVKARLYDSEEDVVQDALRHLLRARPELRIQLNRSIRDWYTQLAVARVCSMAIFVTASVTAGSW